MNIASIISIISIVSLISILLIVIRLMRNTKKKHLKQLLINNVLIGRNDLLRDSLTKSNNDLEIFKRNMNINLENLMKGEPEMHCVIPSDKKRAHTK